MLQEMSEQITEILTFLTVEMAGEAVVTWVENGHVFPWKGVGDQRWNQETSGSSGN